MKIAMIGQKGIPAKSGGIEKHVEHLSLKLSDLGHEVLAYTRPHYSPKHKKNYKKVKLISLRSLKTKNLDAASHTFFASLHAIYKLKDLNIIHYHGIGPSLFAWLPRLLKPSLRVVSTFHCQDYYHQKWSLLARLSLRLGEAFSVLVPHKTIAVSRTLKRYAKAVYGKDIVYTPNATEQKSVNKIATKSEQKVLDKKWSLLPRGYLITVNRLVKHKGIHTLIEAYNHLDPKAQLKKKLVIVGKPSYTDNYLAELKSLAANNPNIIFTGQQVGKDLELLFKNAFAYIHPSESEGLSLALLEAMHYGLPILTSNIPENIEPINGIGLTFRNKNISDLYKRLGQLLALSRNDIKKMARKGQERSRDHYNWENVAQKTEKVYISALSSKARVLLKFKAKKV